MLQKIGRKFLIYWRILKLTVSYWLFGIEVVNEALLQTTIGVPQILQRFGASVGIGCVIHGPLIIHNANKDYANLILGDRVHIGKNVLLDLSDIIRIDEGAVVSMNCTLLTHQDVGDRPLKAIYPAQIRPLQVGRGAYLGASVNVLAGAEIGEFSVVGAGAVLIQSLPPYSVAVGVPAKRVKSIPTVELPI